MENKFKKIVATIIAASMLSTMAAVPTFASATIAVNKLEKNADGVITDAIVSVNGTLDKYGKAVVAIYGSDKSLKDIAISENGLSKGDGNNEYELTFDDNDLKPAEGDTIKTFIWEADENGNISPIPLTNIKETSADDDNKGDDDAEVALIATYTYEDLTAPESPKLTERTLAVDGVDTAVKAIGYVGGGIDGAEVPNNGMTVTFGVDAPKADKYDIEFICMGDIKRRLDFTVGGKTYSITADQWKEDEKYTMSGKAVFLAKAAGVELAEGANDVVVGTNDGTWAPDIIYLNLYNKGETVNTYTVSGIVDGGVKTVALKKDGSVAYNGVIEDNTVTFSDVADGTYDIDVTYNEGKEADTIKVDGKASNTVTVDGADVSIIISSKDTQSQETLYTVEGTVDANVTGVTLSNDTDSYEGTITLNNEVVFEDVKAGTYTIAATVKDGYEIDTIKLGDADATTLTVTSANVTGLAVTSKAKEAPVTKYNVTVADGIENGTVTVDKTSAAAGEEVTITATPADGYELDKITVTNGDTAVTVTDGKFTMPEGNVTVSAVFAVESVYPTNTFEYDFEDGNAVFNNENRCGVSVVNAADEATEAVQANGTKLMKFTAAGNAGNGMATSKLDFADKVKNAVAATVEFDVYSADGRPNFSIYDGTVRTSSTWTKGQYNKDGVLMRLGINSGSSFNAITGHTFGEEETLAFNQWVHVKADIDYKTKKISYTITGTDGTVITEENVDYESSLATYATGLEIYTWSNNEVDYVDNVKVTTKVSTAQDIKFNYCDTDGNLFYATSKVAVKDLPYTFTVEGTKDAIIDNGEIRYVFDPTAEENKTSISSVNENDHTITLIFKKVAYQTAAFNVTLPAAAGEDGMTVPVVITGTPADTTAAAVNTTINAAVAKDAATGTATIKLLPGTYKYSIAQTENYKGVDETEFTVADTAVNTNITLEENKAEKASLKIVYTTDGKESGKVSEAVVYAIDDGKFVGSSIAADVINAYAKEIKVTNTDDTKTYNRYSFAGTKLESDYKLENTENTIYMTVTKIDGTFYIYEDFESYAADALGNTVPGFGNTGTSTKIKAGASGQGNVLWLRGGATWKPMDWSTNTAATIDSGKVQMEFDMHYGYLIGKTNSWTVNNSAGESIVSVDYDSQACAITAVKIAGITKNDGNLSGYQDKNNYTDQNKKAHITVVVDLDNKTAEITLKREDTTNTFSGSIAGLSKQDIAAWVQTNNQNNDTRCSTVDNFSVTKLASTSGGGSTGGDETEKDYQVTVNTATNGTVEVDKTSAKAGDVVTITTTPATGYELDTVTVMNGETAVTVTDGKFTMPAGNVTVTATFKAKTPVVTDYQVTVNAATNGTVEVDKTSAKAGDVVTITTTPATGYELDTVTVMNGETAVTVTDSKFTMPSGNVTVTATFKAIQYTLPESVELDDVNHADYIIVSIADDKKSAAKDEEVTLKVNITDDEYYIQGITYYLEGSTVPVEIYSNATDGEIKDGKITFKMPEKNIAKIVVHSVAKSYTAIVADGITNGTVAIKGDDKATKGVPVGFTVTPDTGYEVENITVKDENGEDVEVNIKPDSYTFEMPSGGATISATFKAIDYKVTANEAENGTVEADKTTANMCDVVTITAKPATGYELDTITVMNGETPVEVKDGKFTMPAGDVSVTATFKAKTYNITKGEIKNGTVEVAENAKVGDEVTITAKPTTGYEVDTITATIGETAVEVKDGKFTMPAGDVTVTATFKAKSYKIDNLFDSTKGTVEVESNAVFGSEVTVTVKPNDGYDYKITVISGDNEYAVDEDGKFTMPAGDVSVTTTFKAKTYNITKGTMTNGEVTVAENAKYGETVEVTVKAADNYKVQSVTYTVGEKTTAIAPVDGKYTFTMPVGDVTINAVFVDASTNFDITYAAMTNGKVSGNTSAEKESIVSFTVTPEAGYKLSKLTYTPKGGLPVEIPYDEISGYVFTMPDKDVTINAEFTAIDYKITDETTDTNGAVSFEVKDSDEEDVAHVGDTIEIEVAPADGYKLSKLLINGEDYASKVADNKYSYTMGAENTTIKAEFTEADFNVTFANDDEIVKLTDAEDDNVETNVKVAYKYKSAVTFKPEIINEAYELSSVKWYYKSDEGDTDKYNALTADESGYYSLTMPNKDIEIHISAAKKTFDVVHSIGGTFTFTGMVSCEYGEDYTATITPAAEYEIKSVTVNETPVDKDALSYDDGEYTLTVKEVKDKLNIVITTKKKQYSLGNDTSVDNADKVTIKFYSDAAKTNEIYEAAKGDIVYIGAEMLDDEYEFESVQFKNVDSGNGWGNIYADGASFEMPGNNLAVKYIKVKQKTYTIGDVEFVGNEFPDKITVSVADDIKAAAKDTDVTLNVEIDEEYYIQSILYYYNTESGEDKESIYQLDEEKTNMLSNGDTVTFKMPNKDITKIGIVASQKVYTATIATPVNGTVKFVDDATSGAVSKESPKGSTVSFYILPNEGYEIDTVTVTDSDDGTVATTNAVDEVGQWYMFNMPNKAVTISATFKKQPVVSLDFENYFEGEEEKVFDTSVFTGNGTVAVDNDPTDEKNKVLKVNVKSQTSTNQSIKYSFADKVDDATSATVEFDSYITGGRNLISIADENVRGTTWSANSNNTTGVFAWQGINTSDDAYKVNGDKKDDTNKNAWLHTKASFDYVNKKMSLVVTDSTGAEVYNQSDIAYVDTNALYATAVYFDDWTGTDMYIDNFKVYAEIGTANTVTINYTDKEGTVFETRTDDTAVNTLPYTYNVVTDDNVLDNESVRYVLDLTAENNKTSISAVSDTDKTITLVYDKYTYQDAEFTVTLPEAAAAETKVKVVVKNTSLTDSTATFNDTTVEVTVAEGETAGTASTKLLPGVYTYEIEGTDDYKAVAANTFTVADSKVTNSITLEKNAAPSAVVNIVYVTNLDDKENTTVHAEQLEGSHFVGDTISKETIDAYAVEKIITDTEKGTFKIYKYVSGSVETTLEKIDGDEKNTNNIYLLMSTDGEEYYYKEDFSGYDDTSETFDGVTVGASTSIAMYSDDKQTNALRLWINGNKNTRISTVAFGDSIGANKKVKLEMMMQIAACNSGGNTFTLNGTDGALFTISNEANFANPKINGDAVTLTTTKEETISRGSLQTTNWLKITANADFENGVVNLKVVDAETNAEVYNKTYATDVKDIKNLTAAIGVSWAAFAIDDVKITTADLTSQPITIKYVNSEGVAIKDSATAYGINGYSYTVADSEKAVIKTESGDEYTYDTSSTDTINEVSDTANTITLKFNKVTKYTNTVKVTLTSALSANVTVPVKITGTPTDTQFTFAEQTVNVEIKAGETTGTATTEAIFYTGSYTYTIDGTSDYSAVTGTFDVTDTDFDTDITVTTGTPATVTVKYMCGETELGTANIANKLVGDTVAASEITYTDQIVVKEEGKSKVYKVKTGPTETEITSDTVEITVEYEYVDTYDYYENFTGYTAGDTSYNNYKNCTSIGGVTEAGNNKYLNVSINSDKNNAARAYVHNIDAITLTGNKVTISYDIQFAVQDTGKKLGEEVTLGDSDEKNIISIGQLPSANGVYDMSYYTGGNMSNSTGSSGDGSWGVNKTDGNTTATAETVKAVESGKFAGTDWYNVKIVIENGKAVLTVSDGTNTATVEDIAITNTTFSKIRLASGKITGVNGTTKGIGYNIDNIAVKVESSSTDTDSNDTAEVKDLYNTDEIGVE